jgi:opacity protein-like surface antigen
MRRLLQTWATGLTLLALGQAAGADTAAQSPAWSDTEGEVLVLQGQLLELHTAAGKGYPIFHALERGEQLRIFKRRADWFKVETQDGKLGWVHRRQLTQLTDPQGQWVDFSNPGWQDAAQNPWQLGLLVGNIEGALGYTTYLNYRFTDHLSTELKYTQAYGDFSTTKMASLHLLHQPFPSWRLSPFFSLGTGSVKVSPNAVVVKPEDRQDSFIGVGAGLIWHLSARVDMRAEYQKDTILTTRDANEEIEEWKAGFSLLF